MANNDNLNITVSPDGSVRGDDGSQSIPLKQVPGRGRKLYIDDHGNTYDNKGTLVRHGDGDPTSTPQAAISQEEAALMSVSKQSDTTPGTAKGKAANFKSSGKGTLRKGSRGPAVSALQQDLKDAGYDIEVDGIFGKGTDKAVREFQKANGLKVDGKVGTNTRKKIQLAKDLNIDFDDQSFLWDHLDDFKNEKVGGLPNEPSSTPTRAEASARALNRFERISLSFFNASPILYKNFLQIEDDEPVTTTNLLFADGISSLNNITTAQLSSIVPYFKLLKVLPQQPGSKKRKRLEFPFNKYTTMGSILQSRENRGTDVGLKNVSWEDTGANPGNTGLAFKGDMTLHFQSFEGIFKSRRVDGEAIRFADIMVLESLTGRSAKKNPSSQMAEQANDTNVNCNTVTEIHMECGWTLPPHGLKGTRQFRKELEKLRRTYILTPIDQEISVTDNGAVDMKVTFCAAQEGRAFGAASDLLNISDIDPESTTAKFAGRENLRVTTLRANIKDKHKKRIAAKKESKDLIKKRQDEIKKLQTELGEARANLRGIQYQRFLTVLRQGVGKSDNLESRIFYANINSGLMNRYKQYLQDSAMGYELYQETKEKEDKLLARESFEYYRSTYKNDLAAGEYTFTTSNQAGFVGSLGNPALDDEGKLKEPSKEIDESGRYRLHYIYLGDIIEAAMSILYDNPYLKDGKIVGTDKPACPVVKNNVRVLMGSLSFLDPSTGRIANIALADVPVAFNYFNAWWHNSVVKRELSSYPLRQFLSDLCGTLLNNVMSPKRYGGMPGKKMRCTVQSVWTKDGHPLDSEWSRTGDKPKKRINAKEVFKHPTKGKANLYSQWLYVSVAGGQTENSKLKGKIDEDEDRNIPHYFVGADTGVVKNISFSKTKIPGKRESLIFRSKENGTAADNLLFSDRYDANIRVIGNPVFKPGMLVYVDPRSMGLGMSDINPAEYMSSLGIGGYYRVVRVNSKLDSSTFETEIKTISEFSSREIARNKKGGS
tara:strand:- start:2109 stop:5096 length:2988 start_codon:yes stop_codon:yes gene_type:complete